MCIAASWSGVDQMTSARYFLKHALLVSDVMVAIELSCREKDGVRLLYEDGLRLQSEQDFTQWSVRVREHGVTLGVVPDRVFALEFKDHSSHIQRVHFFLEADRGTMPVVRSGLTQLSSFYRQTSRLRGDLDAKGSPSGNFGIHRFRVLAVTTNAMRVKSLLDACARLNRGHGLFLFADRTVLVKDILSPVWQCGQIRQNMRLSWTCHNWQVLPPLLIYLMRGIRFGCGLTSRAATVPKN